jgi:SAM-dependent methyltransferase
MAEAGHEIHGEADFVQRYGPATVLDAGCGTGRVGIELARRGVHVIGADLDPAMLEVARAKAPDIRWELADLGTLDLRDDDGAPVVVDLVVLAGNVMIFVAAGTEAAVLARCVAHLRPGGLVIAGFQLRPGGLALAAYDAAAASVGLEPVDRFATWDGDPFVAGGDYAVSAHRTPAA